MQPESNHTSHTSFTRFMSDEQSGQERIMSSTNGRCGSISPVKATFDKFRSSSKLPIQIFFGQPSQTQTGKGVPQYRSREKAQSFTSRNHSPNRPSLMFSGSQ